MGSAGQSARWAAAAIRRLDDDAERIGCTPLLTAPLPAEWGVTLLLKDESAQPTRTLKHRAARALFRLAIASGSITEGSTVVEATGGGAAVAQAYFVASSSLRRLRSTTRPGGSPSGSTVTISISSAVPSGHWTGVPTARIAP